MLGWLAHVAGLDNPSGHWYAFWSGIFGDLPQFAVLALVWRRLNCHVKGCHRIGLHKVEGAGWVTCRRHHPTLPDKAPSADEIADTQGD